MEMLHGQPNAVETIFNAEQGKKLWEFVKGLPETAINAMQGKIDGGRVQPVLAGATTSASTDNSININHMDVHSSNADNLVSQLRGIANLKEIPGTPEEDFNILSKYVRSFFKEYLDLSNSLTYLELEKIFKKQNKPDYAALSKLMSDIKYKGQKTPKNIMQATNLFERIIENY
jgi:hypothetical protein